MATLGAIVGHEASETANEAIHLKNEAVLKKAEASRKWAYYRQVSTKAHLLELAKALMPEAKHAGYDEKLAKYAGQKDEIQDAATGLLAPGRNLSPVFPAPWPAAGRSAVLRRKERGFAALLA